MTLVVAFLPLVPSSKETANSSYLATKVNDAVVPVPVVAFNDPGASGHHGWQVPFDVIERPDASRMAFSSLTGAC